jgi:hypothetical protein
MEGDGERGWEKAARVKMLKAFCITDVKEGWHLAQCGCLRSPTLGHVMRVSAIVTDHIGPCLKCVIEISQGRTALLKFCSHKRHCLF